MMLESNRTLLLTSLALLLLCFPASAVMTDVASVPDATAVTAAPEATVVTTAPETTAVTTASDPTEAVTTAPDPEGDVTTAPAPSTITIEWGVPDIPYKDETVQVGDTVTFEWPYYKIHNVVIHPTGNCSLDGAKTVGSFPGASYMFIEADAGKDMTFASDLFGECEDGQIITFSVAGEAAATAASVADTTSAPVDDATTVTTAPSSAAITTAPDPTTVPDQAEAVTAAPDPTEAVTTAPDPTEAVTTAPGPTEAATTAPDPTENVTSAPDLEDVITTAPSSITLEWAVPGSQYTYADKPAQVGDTVTFTWPYYKIHNVAIHPTGDCSTDGAIAVGRFPGAKYTFIEADAGKDITFASDRFSDCENGQIITFLVAGEASTNAQATNNSGRLRRRF